VSRRTLGLVAPALLVCALAASGYYPFVHYTSSAGPFQVAPEKFDLSALPNGTLHYFVSGKGPDKLAAGDSFTSILSQVRQAAKVWNDVETSALRFEFGGLSAAGVTQTTPGVDVYFGEVELPPGLIALGGPTSRSALISRDGSAFVPVTRSILVLGTDLSQRPSHGSAFFLTAVHELGHALGLQHTMTSSVMSTDVTRSTTRSIPLAADDVAGISLLYPTPAFAKRTGSISGRVTLDGVGVHLASVVALEPAGAAVSALTDRDGYFSIGGLAPGQYYLYTHALPPGGQPELGPAEIVLPVLPDGSRVPAGPIFEAVFHPNVKNFQYANTIAVRAGKDASGYDFSVRGREPLEVHSVTTYSFPGSIAVKPAFLNVYGPRNFLVASGKGLVTGDAPTPGLEVSVVGGSANVLQDTVKAYSTAPSFLQIGFGFSPFGGEGPRHLVFSLNGEIHVLPAGVHLVKSQPPSVAGITAGTDAEGRQAFVVTGSNLMRSTRIMFDGLPATMAGFDATTGTLTVIPPQGASGHRAVVTAVDSDGQDSLFLDGANPPSYTYDAAGAPHVALWPTALPAGSESMIEITGESTSFAEGHTVIGFGSSDVVVRRVWAVGPNRLLANVHVSPDAKTGVLPLSVVTGFQMASRDLVLDVQPPLAGVPVVNPVAVNPNTGQPSVFAGGLAALSVAQIPAGLTAAAVSVTIDELPASVLAVEEGRVTVSVPGPLEIGPAILRLGVNGLAAAPVVVAIDPAPPVIRGVESLAGEPIGTDRPALIGQSLWVTITALDDPDVLAEPSRLELTLGGVAHAPVTLLPSKTMPGGYDIRIEVSAEVEPGDSVPLTAAIGYRVSQPVVLALRAAN